MKELLLKFISGKSMRRMKAGICQHVQGMGCALSRTAPLLNIAVWEYDPATGAFAASENLSSLLAVQPGSDIRNIDQLLSCFKPADKTTITQLLATASPGGQVSKHVECVQNKTWLSLTLSFHQDMAGRKHVLGTVQDITSFKEKELELKQALHKSHELNKLNSERVAHLSHEIRTPLQAIQHLISQLGYQEATSPAHQESLRALHGVSQNLLAIANQALNLAKLESGRARVEKIRFRLKDTLSSVHRSLLLCAQEKNITFTLAIAPDVPDEVVGDQVKLTQILYNLVGNAIKFTETGGVTLQAQLVSEIDHGQYEVEFSVTDSGIGIAQKNQAQLFESYFQAEAGTSRKYAGTGLGLAITKRLVDLLGGNISLSSQLGKGTVFRVKLSYAQAPAPTGMQPCQERLEKLPQTRILIVEDNPFNSLITGRLLKQWAAETHTASNGREAIVKCAHNSYDLILMDLHMPELSGHETISILRKQGCHMPIIVMTGSTESADRESVLAAGATDYLLKPVHPQALHARILHQLMRSKSHSLSL